MRLPEWRQRYCIQSVKPKHQSSPAQKKVVDKPNSVHILNAEGFEIEAKDQSLIFALVAKE